MRWQEITIWTHAESVEAVSYWFHENGAGGVSIEESAADHQQRESIYGELYGIYNDIPTGEVLIKSYFPLPCEPDQLLAGLKDLLEQLQGWGLETGRGQMFSHEVDDEDWAHAWKSYYKPISLSPYLAIKPSWESYEPLPGQHVVELDPGMAFGTGTHATTVLCLRLIERYLKAGDRVIDVGTGSGILAIAAAALGASPVLGIDLDPVAVQSATENVQMNGLQDQIEIRHGDLLSQISDDEATSSQEEAQLIVANILAEILVSFVDDVYRALASGGVYITSGIIASKAPMVTEALEKAGFVMVDQELEDDWVALAARKP